MECFKCGVSGDRALLFDAISNTGIVKICRKCSFEENIPIIKKFNSDSSQFEKKQTVRQRLSTIAGVESKNNITSKDRLTNKQDSNLKEIINKNFETQIKNKKPRDDLISNFHWVIMRVRRSRKITQTQLAIAIEEPEMAIKMAEQGVVPEDNKLINKIENYLGINLVKNKISNNIGSHNLEDVEFEISDLSINIGGNEVSEQEKSKEISFDKESTKNLTISDLKEMKIKKENEILSGKTKEDYIFNEETNQDEEKPEFIEKKDKEDLSQEDIDNLIFGKND